MANLSKSRIQSGRQCQKRLWLEIHDPKKSQWTFSAQSRMDEGTAFGILAQELLGCGVLVTADHLHVNEALTETRGLLDQSIDAVPMIFEPAFSHEGVRVRVDAYERHRDGDTLIEIKSTAGVKTEHIWDCAIQTWVARGSGQNVTRVMLGHADSESFVYSKENDYQGLLKLVDITADVEAIISEIPKIVQELKAVAAGGVPSISTGTHCVKPYGCPFIEFCRSSEPDEADYPVQLLPRVGELANRLVADGYRDLRDVPLPLLVSPLHRRIAEVTQSGKPFVSSELKSILSSISYPRYFLDFETISYIVPRWIGTRSFQQLPFQYSCHREQEDGTLSHKSFLDISGSSPFINFIEKLIYDCGDEGAIVVWNQGFESSRLSDLSRMFPQYSNQIEKIISRMVDLLPIYRRHYYHREMRGSWSIKNVLPTVAPELDYGDLEVSGGQAAAEAYKKALDPSLTIDEVKGIEHSLLAYCERDTLAMIRLANFTLV